MLQKYDETQIQVLEGLEAVRKRPGMYIGSTGPKGLHHLVYEIVDNAIDEALAGFCTEIGVRILPGEIIEVSDNGRGIPVGIHPTEGISAATVVYTVLHAGGKFGGGGYKHAGGLHGVGSSVVNALSEWLELTIFDGTNEWFQRFERGNYSKPIEIVGTAHKTGTTVRFKADPEIFKESDVYDYETLLTRLREEAFLNAGLSIIYSDERGGVDADGSVTRSAADGGIGSGNESHVIGETGGNHVSHLKSSEPREAVTLKYDGGIRQFVDYIQTVRGLSPLCDGVIYVSGADGDSSCEIALMWNDSYNEVVLSFANNVYTPDGGTHEVGFKNALTRSVNEYAKKFNLLKADDKFAGEDVREGLCAIVSVKLADCEFEGQTKGRLGNPEVKPFVDKLVYEKIGVFLEEHPEEAARIIEKCSSAQNAREAAKKAREAARKKSQMESMSLPGKLADCTEHDLDYSEIYIVEGDSAGGSAKQGRDRKFQAILSLWGKMLNVEKARIDRVYGNEKLMPIVAALGTSIGEDFDINKLRYGKVIIMADADVDGSHIRTLLLTFFFRFMRPLVEEGHIWLAQPPLFKISRGKKFRYAFSDEERDMLIRELSADGGKCDVQRYKGLGEMDPDQLWETTMDPERRTMVKVGLDDAIKADEIITILMGDKVAPRRDFIEKNAKYVGELDI